MTSHSQTANEWVETMHSPSSHHAALCQTSAAVNCSSEMQKRKKALLLFLRGGRRVLIKILGLSNKDCPLVLLGFVTMENQAGFLMVQMKYSLLLALPRSSIALGPDKA